MSEVPDLLAALQASVDRAREQRQADAWGESPVTGDQSEPPAERVEPPKPAAPTPDPNLRVTIVGRKWVVQHREADGTWTTESAPLSRRDATRLLDQRRKGEPPRQRPKRPAPSGRPSAQTIKVRRVECPAHPAYGPSGCGAPAGEKCRDDDGTEREANHKARITAHKRAYPTHESIHVSQDVARDYYGREHEGRSGALYDQPCVRCDESLTIGQGRPVKTKRGYVHALCASGADDE